MVKYKVTFGLGSNTFLKLEVEHCYKHGTHEELEVEMLLLAKRLGAVYLYKEEPIDG